MVDTDTSSLLLDALDFNPRTSPNLTRPDGEAILKTKGALIIRLNGKPLQPPRGNAGRRLVTEDFKYQPGHIPSSNKSSKVKINHMEERKKVQARPGRSAAAA